MECLSSAEQRALEEDLKLASKIQGALLPRRELRTRDWEVAYLYEGAGVTSGDYCDLLTAENGDLHFVLGDVSGKGVAASLLMAHLHASFRALLTLELPLRELVERVNAVFSEITLPIHFATLIYGRANAEGEIQIANAGHIPPLLLRKGRISELPATGIPLGMFQAESYAIHHLNLGPGDTLLLYTDGLSEARDDSGAQYDDGALRRFLGEHSHLEPYDLIEEIWRDLREFRRGRDNSDDTTLMAIRRAVSNEKRRGDKRPARSKGGRKSSRRARPARIRPPTNKTTDRV